MPPRCAYGLLPPEGAFCLRAAWRQETPEGLVPSLEEDADGRAGRGQVSKQAGIGLAGVGLGPGARTVAGAAQLGSRKSRLFPV